MTDVDVVVVGGGISGLSAAHALCARGARVRLIERETACGGVIHTDRVGQFIVDTGPDTLLAHKPAAIALAREVGLGAQLVAPLPTRTTYVLKRSRLRTLPQTSALGLPTDWKTLVSAQAFSWPGKLRMAAEVFVPPAAAPGDESIGSFVRRRFGREALTYVAAAMPPACRCVRCFLSWPTPSGHTAASRGRGATCPPHRARVGRCRSARDSASSSRQSRIGFRRPSW
jgi:protoporphyrinogen oxidase